LDKCKAPILLNNLKHRWDFWQRSWFVPAGG